MIFTESGSLALTLTLMRQVTSLTGEAKAGEFWTFQVGLWAHQDAVKAVSLSFEDLISVEGRKIGAGAFNCFNLGGTALCVCDSWP